MGIITLTSEDGLCVFLVNCKLLTTITTITVTHDNNSGYNQLSLLNWDSE